VYSNLGLAAFWTTRLSPIVEGRHDARATLSGRLVPLSLMPEWAGLADVLPFVDVRLLRRH
jgi:ABC-2 type transport system permease protein